ncbi:MAG: peptidoglycan D,D-transpeptidase FtsI family protein, partial [Acetobacteraceae bacterium]
MGRPPQDPRDAARPPGWDDALPPDAPPPDAPPPGALPLGVPPLGAPSPGGLPRSVPPGGIPRTRPGAARLDAVPRMETVRVTAPDLRRRALQQRTRNRLVATAGGFVVLFAALLVKLSLATVFAPLRPPPARHRLASLLDHPAELAAPLPVHRAMITDRDGQILAISLPSAALYADPRQIVDPAGVAAALQRVLPDLDQVLAARRLADRHRQFVYLDRDITPNEEEAINDLGIPGIDFLPTEIRRYPMGRVAAQVLGGVDVDGNGVAGVEKYFNKRLFTDPTPLRLSIDVQVQVVLRDELARAMNEFQAVGATGIVMKVDTGEVLAMVSLPDYDANAFASAPPDARFNRAASGTYEPGSTFKLQTAAMALNDDVIHIWDRFDTIHPIHIGRFTITDFEPAHSDYALPEIIAQSSNLGASHIALLVGRDRQRAFLRANGMFAAAPIQLPESAPPQVHSKRSWGEATVMTVSFGNGIAVTPIQLITGTASLIDGGVYHDPTLLALPDGAAPPGRRVLRPEVSATMRKLMRIVVTEGTGKPARVPGFLVGAKTGTSQKVSGGGYRRHTNLSSMIAAFPMTHPRYIIYAMLDSPHGNKSTYGFSTGGWVAGPVIRDTIARIGPMLGILPAAPEQLPGLQQALYLPLAPPIPPGAPRMLHSPVGSPPEVVTPASYARPPGAGTGDAGVRSREPRRAGDGTYRAERVRARRAGGAAPPAARRAAQRALPPAGSVAGALPPPLPFPAAKGQKSATEAELARR